MITQTRFYRTAAIILSVALIASLFPSQHWLRSFSANTAYAAVGNDSIASGVPDSVGQAAVNALRDTSLADAWLGGEEMADWQRNNPTATRGNATYSQVNVNTTGPLSISRIQSAYHVGETISNTVIVTYTIANNQLPATLPQIAEGATLTDTVAALETFQAQRADDPNVVRNVLLADTLTAHGELAAAQPSPDHLNGEYAWNLGDIPPLSAITVTVVLTAPETIDNAVNLDSGAAVYGTYLGQMTTASACPVMLSPATLAGGTPVADYLQPTLEADLYDEYVVQKAGAHCQPDSAFTYVRGLQYEVYKGSLRGARGTEWSQAGNSLDLSSLLIAILRGNGTPARYRRGTLDVPNAQALILSMFPTTGPVVGYVPEDAEVSDPANDPELLAEAQDHWWVEAYIDGAWTALDPSFPQATVGQTFTTSTGEPMTAIPDEMRHKVTISLETEMYQSITYLMDGFIYDDALTYTFNTAELVGQPITFKQLVNTQRPPFYPTSCAVFCWTHYTYVPYLRLGDEMEVVIGEQYWELLSNFPFGQQVFTGAWLHFDVQDVDGNTERFTREIGDRLGPEERLSNRKTRGLIPSLLTGDVLQRFNAAAPSLSHELDNYSISFNPSWMSIEYAATVGDNLMAAAPRVLEIQAVGSDIEAALNGETQDISGRLLLDEAADIVEDSTQAFNRMMGATYVTLADGSAQDLGETGLVRAYPDAPRITITSLTIEDTETVSGTEQIPVQTLDLLYDHLRGIAYPGQAKGAEQVYQLTRGMNDTFLEMSVGEMLLEEGGKSAAGILLAAGEQGIPLLYVDADNLQTLANANISDEALGRIWQAAQEGYGILVPERMVMTSDGGQTVAWWQVDLQTGETIGVSEDGTHNYAVEFALIAPIIAQHLLSILRFITVLTQLYLRVFAWRVAAELTWHIFWTEKVADARDDNPNGSLAEIYQAALQETKDYLRDDVWDEFRRICQAEPLFANHCDLAR